MGASSFSPSPMTTTPSMGTLCSTTRMASTAAPSAPSLSPLPIQREAARAAASVTRTSSMARLRSGACLSPADIAPGTYPYSDAVRRRRMVAACLLSAAAGFALAVVLGPRTGITPKRRPRSVVFFRSRTTKRIVALTFDDGPDPRWTPRVLELLHEHRAHATFFLIGRNAQAHPQPVHDDPP